MPIVLMIVAILYRPVGDVKPLGAVQTAKTTEKYRSEGVSDPDIEMFATNAWGLYYGSSYKRRAAVGNCSSYCKYDSVIVFGSSTHHYVHAG